MRSVALCVAAVIGCTSPAGSIETVAHGPSASITTDQISYAGGEAMTVTWSGLPGNTNDWIGIAPEGSPPTTLLTWVYTNGLTAGSTGFSAPATSDEYVARAFENDSYNLIVQSAAFDVVSGSLIADMTTYPPGAAITVIWTNLPGDAHDWIALAPAGSSPQTVLRWVYTNGVASGSTTFAGLPGGNYVARAFLNDTYSLIDESAFTVQAGPISTVTTDQPRYLFDDPEGVVASWSGMPGAPGDFITLAPAGSSHSTITSWRYTNSQASGSTTFLVPQTPTPYVIRLFVNYSYQLAAESAPFTMYTPITVQGSSFFVNQNVFFSWGHAGQPNVKELVLAPAGSPIEAGIHFNNAVGSYGNLGTTPMEAGSFVIRIRYGSILYGESDPFTVTASGATVFTSDNSYPLGSTVFVTWANIVPDGPNNWLAFTAPGAPDHSANIAHWRYITGSGGTIPLSSWAAPAGTYVARIYLNDGYTKIAESTPFTIQP